MADGKIIFGDASGGGGGGADGFGTFGGGAGGAGGGFSDTLTGSIGDDVIFGDGSGGGAGSTTSANTAGGVGGSGNDIINGGSGNDIIFGDGFNGADTSSASANVGADGGLGGGGGGGGYQGDGPGSGGIGAGGIGAGDGGAISGGVFKGMAGEAAVDGTAGGGQAFGSGGGGGIGGGIGGEGGYLAPGNPGMDGSSAAGPAYTITDTGSTIYNTVNSNLAAINAGTYAGTGAGFGGGNDTLDGGAGNDQLMGMGGADTFVMDLSDDAGTTDTIWDYKAIEGDSVKILSEDGTTDISIDMKTGSLAGADANIAGTANGGADSAVFFADGSMLIIKNHSFSDPEPCFLTGTFVTMSDGSQKAVEKLTIGDSVQAINGSAHAIKWMGQRQVSVQFADAKSQNPICITAGALGDNTPVNDLYVSPDHAMYVDEVLVQANALVNDVSIYQVAEMPEDFFYWHIELESHEIILAEGAATETFVDNEARNRFDNAAEFDALYPNAEPVAEMPIARVKSKRQLSQQTLSKLNALSKTARLSA